MTPVNDWNALRAAAAPAAQPNDSWEHGMLAELQAKDDEEQRRKTAAQMERVARIEQTAEELREKLRETFDVPKGVSVAVDDPTYLTENSCIYAVNDRWLIRGSRSSTVPDRYHWDFIFTCCEPGCYTKKTSKSATGKSWVEVGLVLSSGHTRRTSLAAAIKQSTWRCDEHGVKQS